MENIGKSANFHSRVIFFWPEALCVYILPNFPSSKQWKILENQKISTHVIFFWPEALCVYFTKIPIIKTVENIRKSENLHSRGIKRFMWVSRFDVAAGRSGASIRPREYYFSCRASMPWVRERCPPILAWTCRFGFSRGTIIIIFPATLQCRKNGPVDSMSIFLSAKMRQVVSLKFPLKG